MDRISSHRATSLATNRRGAVLVEFALALPLLAILLFGILGYGQYFLFAHDVQQTANDAARAAIGGLNEAERATIVRDSIAASTAAGALDDDRTSSMVAEQGAMLTVTVRYDAGHIPLLRTIIIPMPDTLIERRAVVRMGGSL